jgi:single-stranded DNA-binding protein
MFSENQVCLIGCVDGDVNVVTPTGSIVTFRIKTTDTFYRQGEPVEAHDYFTVKAFGDEARYARIMIAAGTHVYVNGKLRTDRWWAGEERRSAVVVVAGILRALDETPEESNEKPWLQDAAESRHDQVSVAGSPDPETGEIFDSPDANAGGRAGQAAGVVGSEDAVLEGKPLLSTRTGPGDVGSSEFELARGIQAVPWARG